jgi:ABC-type antimicrobial peptide transport system permease subunit
MVLRQGLGPAAVGCAIGLALAGAGSRLLTGFLVGLAPLDPLTFGAVAGLFALIALAACYAPVRSAIRLDVTDALRRE